MHDSQDFEVPTEAQVEIASNAFRLLADQTRIKLLRALHQGESSVSRLADLVAASPTPVSQHLSKLRRDKLVRVRREGTFAYSSAAMSTWPGCWPRRSFTPTTRSSACLTTQPAAAGSTTTRLR
jgi:hypothetical protein